MSMNEAELERLQELRSLITQGMWSIGSTGETLSVYGAGNNHVEAIVGQHHRLGFVEMDATEGPANAEFIVLSHNLSLQLMDELEDFKTYCECNECHAFRSGMVESLQDQLAQAKAEVERRSNLLERISDAHDHDALPSPEIEDLIREFHNPSEAKDAKD